MSSRSKPVPNELAALAQSLSDLDSAFSSLGHQLHIVGGAVRDCYLGLAPTDVDLTTDADVDTIKAVMANHCTSTWTSGEAFGTIGGKFDGGLSLEVTAHRGEAYEADSRNPVVAFNVDLAGDLLRRDFTINAVAYSIESHEIVDPFDGLTDLENQELKTPGAATDSFAEDPLRIFRAARFLTRFSLKPAPELVKAAAECVERIDVVSLERIQGELERLLDLHTTSAGLQFLWGSGALQRTMIEIRQWPQIGELCVAMDSCSDLLVRRAVFCWLAGGHGSKMLRRLRYPASDVTSTQRVVDLARWLVSQPVSFAAVRKAILKSSQSVVAATGGVMVAASKLDDALVESAAAFEQISTELTESGEAEGLVVPLTGHQIMGALNISEGPLVGKAVEWLVDAIAKQGPMSSDEAAKLLKSDFEVNR